MRTMFACILILFFIGCADPVPEKVKKNDKSFSFVFMTDIHLQPQHGYPELPQSADLSPHKAFAMAIDTANKLGVDFAIMGGDMVYDVMRGQNRADSLFQDYKLAVSALTMPVYHTIGNHELYGIYEESTSGPDHPDYKYGMFERYLGNTYYSFDHKGWHFIVLNSLDVKDKRYIGVVRDEQMIWLQNHLAEVDVNTPIVVVSHIPFVSLQRQIYPVNGPNEVPNELWIYNRKEVLDLFSNHNLKLVLQGHLHYTEDIYIYQKDIRFITGGAIAGRPSWRGFVNDEPSGFLKIEMHNEDISWSFIDFGWRDYVLNYQ